MAASQKSMTEEKSKPIWSKRYWTGSGNLEVAVWKREIGTGPSSREVLNTTIKKTYKDGDRYKASSSFRPEEIGLVILALQQAFAYISSQQGQTLPMEDVVQEES